MEESEQRRERLRAMRSEASAAEGCPSFETPAGKGGLANPLVESQSGQDSLTTPRFDYYTDPMAAFSGNKRQNNFSQSPRDISMSRGGGSPIMRLPPPPPLGPGNPEMMYQSNYADQRMQNAGRPPYYGPDPVRSPMAMANPHPEHQHHGFPNQHGIPGYNHSGSFPGGPGYNHPGRFPGGLHMPRPGPQWAGNPSSGLPHGQGHWVNSGLTTNTGSGRNPFPDPGRGRGRGRSSGHWTGNSPSPGGSGHGSGGRGIGYRGNATPNNLYRKSMVEDPWKDLTPVVWKGAQSARIFENFRNSSSSAKKPRVVAESSDLSDSKVSLADYLATAFDEAVEEGDTL